MIAFIVFSFSFEDFQIDERLFIRLKKELRNQ